MVEYILGNYLVGSGKLTEEQLEVVVGQLDKIRVKLGLIAVAEGMMTLAQADEVNRLQSVMDKRFGDIAVEKGYLTDALNVSPFDTEREIAGVTVKVWGGHSEASSIVTFLHNGREYVIAGDECYQRECLTEKRPTGSSFNKEKSLAFVETFSSDAYTVLMSHDPAILPGQNGYLKII